MSDALTWTLSEIGRLGFTHALDPAPIAAALGVDEAVIATLFATGDLDRPTPSIDARTASYVLNILIRLEVRCTGDGGAIRDALARSSPDLSGRSIADALGAGPDLARLVAIRSAAGTLPVPKIRMWRVADSYS